MKTKFVWRMVGLSGLLVGAASLSLTGCGDDTTAEDSGGGGNGTGGTIGSGGQSASGGAGGGGGLVVDPPTCDPPTLAAGGATAIEIEGTYDDDFGSEIVISTQSIVNFGEYHFSQVDNAAGIAIARNDEGNTYNPCAWSVFAWTHDDSDLYFCQSTYDAATEAEAEAAPLPDAEDLEGGCGTFAWSKLTEK